MTCDFNAVMIDFETLATYPHNTIVLDVSAVPFNTNVMQSFDDHVANGFRMKFSVEDQIKNLNRVFSQSTLTWWSEQEEAARAIYVPSADDQLLSAFPAAFESWLESIKINMYKMKVYARGSSFDIGILRSIYYSLYGEDYDVKLPFRYWRERDVRTFIEDMMSIRGDVDAYKVPVPSQLLTGFVKHNSIHDCAKDIIAMHMSRLYAMCDDHPLFHEQSYIEC